jgi:hypothetical protein
MEPTNQQTYRKKATTTALLVVFAGVVIAGVVIGLYLFRPVTRARELVSESAALRIGGAGLKDVQAIAERFGVRAGPDCTPAHCSIGVWVENAQLPSWWRGPGTTFAAGFRVDNGMLVEKGFSLWTGVGPNAPSVEVTERAHWRELAEPVDVGKKYTADEPKYALIISLTPAAPPDVRKRYLSFNFWCLAKFHGCKDAGEMLPTVDWNK